MRYSSFCSTYFSSVDFTSVRLVVCEQSLMTRKSRIILFHCFKNHLPRTAYSLGWMPAGLHSCLHWKIRNTWESDQGGENLDSSNTCHNYFLNAQSNKIMNTDIFMSPELPWRNCKYSKQIYFTLRLFLIDYTRGCFERGDNLINKQQ